MTEDVSAGRLVAEVVSDTTGFARDAKKKIDAEVKALRAKIKAEIDTRGLIGQSKKAAAEASKAAVVRFKGEIDQRSLVASAKAAAREASKAAVVRFKAEVDKPSLIASAKAAATAASKSAVVRLRTEIDTSSIAAEVASATAAGSSSTVNVGVGADTTRAEQDVDRFKQDQENKPPAKLPFSIDSKSLTQGARALKQLSIAPAIAGGVFMLGSAVVQLSGGLISVVSAGSQAVGVLSIIPNLAGVALQGISSLLVGFSGVGNVLGLMGKAETAATAATADGGAQAKATARAVESAMQQRASAAQAVKDAQVSLADAQKAADDQAVMGARAVADAQRALADARAEAVDRQRAAIETVSDAEWSLARAQEASAEAQKSLTAARVAAKQRIDDLNAALKAGSLNEEEAALAVTKATQNLQDVNWNGASSQLDKDQAELAVKQAKEHEAQVKKTNKELAVDAAKANKQGVEGSDEVSQARDRVRDTLHAEQEDTENLADAQRDLTKAQTDSARSIELAQRALGDAIKNNKDGEIAAARAIEQAGRGIVEAKQSYADAVQAVADANDTAAAGGTKAAHAQSLLDAALAKMSPAAQKFAKFIFGLKPQWEGLRNAVQQALLPPLQQGITRALPLLATLQTGLVGSATVVGGLAEKLGALFGSKTFNNDVGTIMDSNNRALQLFGDTGLNIIQILQHLGVAAGPLLERFAAWTKTLTGAWLEEIKVGRETGALQAWLQKAGDRAAQLGSIFGNVGSALFGMGKAAAPAGVELLGELDKVTAKWATFANSDAGQARMKEFFDAAKPTTDEIGRLVTNLAEFITKAGEGGGGSLNGFLQTLNLILTGLNKIMDIPGAAPFLGWLMTLAGVGGALGLVSSVVLRMVGNLGKLAKVTGLEKIVGSLRGAGDAASGSADAVEGRFVKAMKSAGTAVGGAVKAVGGWIAAQGRAAAAAALTTAKLVAQRLASVAMAVASGIARAAAVAWTAVQWLLNAAMSANPLGLLVIAIGILIGAFILAWQHSTQFRDIVTGALNTIKAVAVAVFKAVGDGVSWLIGWVGDHWVLIVSILGGPLGAAVALIITHWSDIKAAFGAAWNWVKTNFAKAWATAEAILLAPIKAGKAGIDLVWSGLKTAFSAVTGWVKDNWSKAWNAIKTIITGPIDAAKTVIGTILGKNGIQKVFSDGVKAITTIWDGLKKAAQTPIKFIIETVLNGGLIDGFNWLAGKVGINTVIPHIPLPKGFAGGGFNEGEFSGKIRGRKSSKDNLVAQGPLGQRIGLATGEFITKAKETAKNLPLLRAINSGQISSRVSQAIMHGGFADGGVFGGIKKFVTGAASKGKQLGGDVLDVLKDPANWILKRMTGPLDKLKEFGNSPFVQTATAVPRKLIELVKAKAKEILSGLGGGGGGPVNPGLAGALNWVKTQVGKPYLWGGVGPDGYDCSGLMGAIVNVIKGAEDPFKRLFSTASLPTDLFEKGPGAFSIGWFKGNPGHTAGTLNGQNVESRGGRGVLVGDKARGATDSLFNSGVYHLKGFAKGGQFGDLPFDLLSPRGKSPLPSSQDLMEALGVTFDTGGYVGTGTTVINNKTGEKEAMFQPAAWKTAASVLDKIFGVGRAVRGVDSAPAAGAGALVEHLSLSVGDKDDVPEILDEVTHRLRVIDRGGVYADRTP